MYKKDDICLYHVNNIKILIFSNILLLFDFQNINIYIYSIWRNSEAPLKNEGNTCGAFLLFLIDYGYTLCNLI